MGFDLVDQNAQQLFHVYFELLVINRWECRLQTELQGCVGGYRYVRRQILALGSDQLDLRFAEPLQLRTTTSGPKQIDVEADETAHLEGAALEWADWSWG